MSGLAITPSANEGVMKRILLIAVAVLVLAAGAAGAWWHFVDNHDPLAAARRFIKAGDSRAAMIELRRAVQANPASAEAHLRLAGLQLQSGDPVAAEKELKAARDHGAKAPELPLLLAQSYLQQGRQKDLLAEFQPPLATAESPT